MSIRINNTKDTKRNARQKAKLNRKRAQQAMLNKEKKREKEKFKEKEEKEKANRALARERQSSKHLLKQSTLELLLE